MQYNYKGKYSTTVSYVKKDVVSYQATVNDPVRYYFCLTDNIGQSPLNNTDSQYWGVVNALSNFPNSVDTFITRTNIQASDKIDINRFKDLTLQSSLTPSEQDELTTLTQKLRNKILLPDDFNALQESMSNMQMFLKDNIEGFILTKQSEIKAYVDDSIAQMDAKKTYFTNYVDTKEDEVRVLVQEFDSNTARYYQIWNATLGQIDFNIYSGGTVSNIPVEANLNIAEENIDLIINGTLMTPYQDFSIVNNGNYDTIRLTSSASSLIGNGAEVVAKWFKNVGKLYFKHASQHGAGGTDPLTVTEGMLDSTLKTKVNNTNKKITTGLTAPTSPATYDIWIDVH